MKKLILITASTLIASMASSQITSSESMSKQKQTSNAKADESTYTSSLERSIELRTYINGAQEELTGNDKRIAVLKAKLKSEQKKGDKKSDKAAKKLEKNIAILENCNIELKTDLNDYVKYGIGDWSLFKKEFNQELAELGKELNDLRHDYTEFIAENGK